MMIAALVGLSLVTTASIDVRTHTPSGAPAASMSARQKDAAMRPLVRSVTDCIVHSVAADPRLPASVQSGDVTELIVDSMRSCLDPVHAMIDAYDRLYGDGSGQAFFLGPYLDALPAAVTKQVQGAPE
jgi:hypothetical protein